VAVTDTGGKVGAAVWAIADEHAMASSDRANRGTETDGKTAAQAEQADARRGEVPETEEVM
jgi:hypothetical protein